MNHKLEIKPAILPEQRHKIQDALEALGFDVWGGGTNTDMSCCDITFSAPSDAPEPTITPKGIG